jgi:hypothetical protein
MGGWVDKITNGWITGLVRVSSTYQKLMGHDWRNAAHLSIFTWIGESMKLQLDTQPRSREDLALSLIRSRNTLRTTYQLTEDDHEDNLDPS